jgi:hypothetical protein
VFIASVGLYVAIASLVTYRPVSVLQKAFIGRTCTCPIQLDFLGCLNPHQAYSPHHMTEIKKCSYATSANHHQHAPPVRAHADKHHTRHLSLRSLHDCDIPHIQCSQSRSYVLHTSGRIPYIPLSCWAAIIHAPPRLKELLGPCGASPGAGTRPSYRRLGRGSPHAARGAVQAR